MFKRARLELYEKAKDAYYNTGTPIMTDDAFDVLEEELRRADPRHPLLESVGRPVPDNKKATLPCWMGSMDKIKDDPAALSRWKAKYPGECVVSDKLDGMSALLHVKNARARLYSRGDGAEGHDITHLLPHVRFVPDGLVDATVRGEIILSKEAWARPFPGKGKDPRSTVAGVINAKKPNLDAAGLMDFVAYEWVSPTGVSPTGVSPTEQMRRLAEAGFEVVHHGTLEPTQAGLTELLTRRKDESEYQVDGLVVAHDAPHERPTSGNPKHAFAFKTMRTQEHAEVAVTRVGYKMSKDGYLKPLVHFDTVPLGGVSVSKCTGFNARFVHDNKIGPGARISVVRSGDVIPYIVAVLQPAEEPQMPAVPYRWNATGVDAVACADGSGDELRLRRVVHFFRTMGVAGMGESTVEKLFASGLDGVGKILHASPDQLARADRVQAKSAAKLCASLRAVVVKPARVMAASNAFGRGFAEKRLESILRAHPCIVSDRSTPSVAELTRVAGIETKTAAAFLKGLPAFWNFVDSEGLDMTSDPGTNAGTDQGTNVHMKLIGQTVLFTGFRDRDLEASAVAHGATIASTLTKGVSVVVTKDEHTVNSKVDKARGRGVAVVTRADFSARLSV